MGFRRTSSPLVRDAVWFDAYMFSKADVFCHFLESFDEAFWSESRLWRLSAGNSCFEACEVMARAIFFSRRDLKRATRPSLISHLYDEWSYDPFLFSWDENRKQHKTANLWNTVLYSTVCIGGLA